MLSACLLGNGTKCATSGKGINAELEELRTNRADKNRKILEALKPDDNAEELLKQCKTEYDLGQLGPVTKIEDLDLNNVTISPRFGVEQGLKPDGSLKLRPCDDLTRGGCNSATLPAEKFRYDSLDLLISVLRLAFDSFFVSPLLMGTGLKLWKADIDSAYRRIPILPEHRQFAWSVFKLKDGSVVAVQHKCCPFGAISSVHNWDRIGSFLCTAACRLLHLPILRFVDDYFSLERPKAAEHAMQCFARLVRCILGDSAISVRKLEVGNPLTILGVTISLDSHGIQLRPSGDKKLKWSKQIQAALDRNSLFSGEASKISGRLSWASQMCFKRLGRAMLYPIYGQMKSRTGHIQDELRLALEWWLEALQRDICELRPWVLTDTPTCRLLVDARSKPPRLAAVLLIDGVNYYSDWQPPASVMSMFKPRDDGQIMSLELLAIAFGLSTFQHWIKDRNVHIYSDNTGAEHTTDRGGARAFDHTCLIHGIWCVFTFV